MTDADAEVTDATEGTEVIDFAKAFWAHGFFKEHKAHRNAPLHHARFDSSGSGTWPCAQDIYQKSFVFSVLSVPS